MIDQEKLEVVATLRGVVSRMSDLSIDEVRDAVRDMACGHGGYTKVLAVIDIIVDKETERRNADRKQMRRV